MRFRLITAFAVFVPALVSAQAPRSAVTLRAGPMLGATDQREVKIWAQTTAPAKVQVVYWDSIAPQRRIATEAMQTRRDSGNVAVMVADQVEAGHVYHYQVLVNGRSIARPYPLRFRATPQWVWHTDPPPFTLITGSCFYVREPGTDRPGAYGDSAELMMRSIAAHGGDAMLWLGDNAYLREVDWNSWSGILRRWTHTRGIHDIQPLLAEMPHYAIWDDHDYGPNDADRGWWNKRQTRAAFGLFWPNPGSGIPELGDAITTQFQYGDVDVFMLDDRWFRAPDTRKTGSRPYFGDAQLQWFIDALTTSHATFKIVAVGGQVLNPAALWENYATYPDERQRLLDAIAAEKIPGVLFLSGDRHHTELTKLDRPGTYPLYDLTVSPFSAGVSAPAANEQNTGRVDGTLVNARNFAALEFRGPREERVLTLRVFDEDGKELWNREIRASELR